MIQQTTMSYLPDLKEYFKSIIRSMNVLKQSKFDWGLFNIEDNTIKIEHWLPAQGGYPTLLRTGEILNDTTFVLTESIMRGKNGATPKDINQTFYFKHFDIKPDSTNSFIK